MKKNKERERQPKYRSSTGGQSKTPLTFYRSAESKNEVASPFRKKELNPHVGKVRSLFATFFELLIILALLTLLTYSLIIRPSSHVQVSSQVFHETRVYRDAINKILSGLKYSNKITFNEKAVANEIQKQFPEIVSTRIELPILAQTPVIHLKIAKPSFILANNGQSYIVDSEGVAVANTADFPDTEGILTLEDKSGFTTSVGKQVMSARAVQFIDTLTQQCKHSNVPISSLTLPRLAQELDLHTNDRPYYVKFYLGGNMIEQIGQFLATRHQFDTTNTQPAEYLDVRVSGKIFYK